MSFKMNTRIFRISVGLFAYFGPYVVQISALFLGRGHAEEVSLIKPGVNFLTMESISMLPPQCDVVVIVAWGHPSYLGRLKDSYRRMKLVLNQYEDFVE